MSSYRPDIPEYIDSPAEHVFTNAEMRSHIFSYLSPPTEDGDQAYADGLFSYIRNRYRESQPDSEENVKQQLNSRYKPGRPKLEFTTPTLFYTITDRQLSIFRIIVQSQPGLLSTLVINQVIAQDWAAALLFLIRQGVEMDLSHLELAVRFQSAQCVNLLGVFEEEFFKIHNSEQWIEDQIKGNDLTYTFLIRYLSFKPLRRVCQVANLERLVSFAEQHPADLKLDDDDFVDILANALQPLAGVSLKFCRKYSKLIEKVAEQQPTFGVTAAQLALEEGHNFRFKWLKETFNLSNEDFRITARNPEVKIDWKMFPISEFSMPGFIKPETEDVFKLIEEGNLPAINFLLKFNSDIFMFPHPGNPRAEGLSSMIIHISNIFVPRYTSEVTKRGWTSPRQYRKWGEVFNIIFEKAKTQCDMIKIKETFDGLHRALSALGKVGFDIYRQVGRLEANGNLTSISSEKMYTLDFMLAAKDYLKIDRYLPINAVRFNHLDLGREAMLVRTHKPNELEYLITQSYCLTKPNFEELIDIVYDPFIKVAVTGIIHSSLLNIQAWQLDLLLTRKLIVINPEIKDFNCIFDLAADGRFEVIRWLLTKIKQPLNSKEITANVEDLCQASHRSIRFIAQRVDFSHRLEKVNTYNMSDSKLALLKQCKIAWLQAKK